MEASEKQQFRPDTQPVKTPAPDVIVRVVLKREKAGTCQPIARDANFLVVILNVTLLRE